MIKGNILFFGQGDIGVDSNSFRQTIIFTNIKPPCECGESITEELIKERKIEFGEQIIIEMDNYELYDLFCLISEDNRMFEYRGYIFDFTNYNVASVSVCKEHSKQALYFHQMSLAC